MRDFDFADVRHFADARKYEEVRISNDRYLCLQEMVTEYCKNLKEVFGVRANPECSLATQISLAKLPRLTRIDFCRRLTESQVIMQILEKLNNVQSVDAKWLRGYGHNGYDYDMENDITMHEKLDVPEISVGSLIVFRFFRAESIRKLTTWEYICFSHEFTQRFITALSLCRNVSQVELNLQLSSITFFGSEKNNFPLIVSAAESLPQLETLVINMYVLSYVPSFENEIKQFIDIFPQILKYIRTVHLIRRFYGASGNASNKFFVSVCIGT